MHNNIVNNVDANVQRLLLEALDSVVDLRDPVDEVSSIHIGDDWHGSSSFQTLTFVLLIKELVTVDGLLHLPVISLLFQQALKDLVFIFLELKYWSIIEVPEMPQRQLSVPVLQFALNHLV